MRFYRIIFVGVFVTIFSGCAVFDSFMAGYRPPQTIADLLLEQRLAAGELPPELGMNGEQKNTIGIDDYQGENPEQVERQNSEFTEHFYSPYRQVKAFRPSFTYKSVYDYAAQLSMALVQNRNGLDNNAKVAIGSFVLLDESLQNTTVLGNQLAEYLIAQMQQQGIPVVDHKLMPVLAVTPRGDVSFSRDTLALSQRKVMDHVLSGTLIHKPNGVFVNARIIALHTNRVVSSATLLIPDFVLHSANRGYAGLN